MDPRDAIKAIFFSEFHPTAGPKITYQVPEDYIKKDVFENVHAYIITKPEIQDKLITINAFGLKIVGCPVCIEAEKYPRNAFLFNLCFICSDTSHTSQYEPVVKKLSTYFRMLECEYEYLSNENTKFHLPRILSEILTQLNNTGSCTMPVNESTTLYLKIIPHHSEPGPVQPHDVPILITNDHIVHSIHWDEATLQILPYVDGFRHVKLISVESGVEIDIVVICIQNMIYHNVVKLISIFQYSNIYTVTPVINQLAVDTGLQQECIQYILRSRHEREPVFRDVFVLYCGLQPGTTVKDLCSRYHPSKLNINERKLIQYGLMKGFIRRLHKYPINVEPSSEDDSSTTRLITSWFTGSHHYDEICCLGEISYRELDHMIDDNPNVLVCWK